MTRQISSRTPVPPPPSSPRPRVEPTAPTSEPPAAPASVDTADPFRWYGEQEWSCREPAPRKWLLTRAPDPSDPASDGAPVGFLPMGKVGMLAAAGGAGKTMALLQLAVSVATGRQWLGDHGFEVPDESRGNVCLLLAEEDAEEVQRRILAIKQGLDLRTGSDAWESVRRRLMILPMAGLPAQFIDATSERGRTEETDFFREFKQHLGKHEWKLIVLDPLSRLATAETEVDNHHATRFVATIEQLVSLPGSPAVLVAHHTSKAARGGATAGTASAARGASGLTDGVRWAATLEDIEKPKGEKGERQLYLSLVKHNYNAPALPRPLVRGAFGLLNVATPDDTDAHPTPAPPTARSKAKGKPTANQEDYSDIPV